jgi:hypothetical protein
MRKIAFAIAALTAVAVAAPSIANAETVVVKHGGHHWHHRDWHPFHHHHDKVVIMKHRHD